MNLVDVAFDGVEEPAWTDRLIAFAGRVLSEEGIDCWDLSILLCGDAAIRDLNSRFRGKDARTTCTVSYS